MDKVNELICESVLLIEAERQLDILKHKIAVIEKEKAELTERIEELQEAATDMWIYGVAGRNSKGRWADAVARFERIDALLNETKN